MSNSHDKPKKPSRVSEAAPVQVFFGRDDRARLDRLTTQLDATKSEVLRRSLVALEKDLLDPNNHPALRIVGLVDDDAGTTTDFDAAVEHDRALADSYEAITPPATATRRRGKQ
jgi:hypothetical protein